MATPAQAQSEQLNTSIQAPVTNQTLPYRVDLQVGQQLYAITWKVSELGLQPVLKPRPKNKADALGLTAAIARRLGELHLQFDQLGAKLEKDKDKLYEEIQLLQTQLDEMLLKKDKINEEYDRTSTELKKIVKEREELGKCYDDLKQKYELLISEQEEQHKIVESYKERLADTDSRLAIAAIGSWVEEARILVLQNLGYTNISRQTLSTNWHKFSELKSKDGTLASSFHKVINDLFGLKSFEWTKISIDFYSKKRNGTVHERPPAEKALTLLPLLPDPFNNVKNKELFKKLIEKVAKQIANTEEDVCA